MISLQSVESKLMEAVEEMYELRDAGGESAYPIHKAIGLGEGLISYWNHGVRGESKGNVPLSEVHPSV